jgi:hypothetical protein
MPELGEPITNPMTFVKDKHDKKICPWHDEGEAGAEMAAADENDDKPKGKVKAGRSKTGMPKNDGGKLGDALIDAGYAPPEASVQIYFIEEGMQEYRKDGKDKEMILYARSIKKASYDLDFAAHHLIPGNAALKDSAIAPFLGDSATVKNFSSSSKIEKGSAGYDVNCHENGHWLPSPYALSMNDGNSPAAWPNEPGMKAALRDEGEKTFQVLESFKIAYAKEAVRVSGGRQFHMCHEDYSIEVKKHLQAVKIKMMTCPEVDEKKDKFDKPPGGLRQTLISLSARLRGLVTGKVWHSPFLVDDINESIASKSRGKRYVVAQRDKVI